MVQSSTSELDRLIKEQAADAHRGSFQPHEFSGMLSLDVAGMSEALTEDGLAWKRDKLLAFREGCPLHGAGPMYRKLDGRLTCRECRRVDDKAYRDRNPVKTREKALQRYHGLSPEAKEREKARQRAWWAANKDQINARRRARAESSRKRDAL